jgi:hypothetical protein
MVGIGLEDEVREFHFLGGRRSIARPPLRRILDGGDHLRMGVTQNHRPPRKHIVDIRVPVHIVEPGAPGMMDEKGVAAHGFEGSHGTVDSAGNGFLGAPEEKPGFPPVRFHDGRYHNISLLYLSKNLQFQIETSRGRLSFCSSPVL